ncbi:MarR family transcriptional regulator [Paenibacillus taichungensis]|uniref:MarR family transcriptional regulator n=1 Tax=Paenibacillus taichungensis TaxID=484184 RepID=A0A329QHA2_9BACL|nr:MarR family transcriptional regulator [Paenibacillus taichungensis]RAW11795.1 MarR family transcriptional regulator [Paenibacillus taichungensis]
MINPSDNQNKDHLIQEVLEAVKDIQIRFQTEEDEEKQWLIQNSPNPAVEELIQEMTVTMLHVLDAIGTLEPVNGITISKQFGFSKGTVSKITRRLVSQKIIVTESLPDNKKEVLFRTTSLGKEIYRLHQGLHHQIDLGVHHFLQRYNEDELQFLVNTLQKTLHTSWIHSETEEETYESARRDAPTNKDSKAYKANSSSSLTEEMDEIMSMLNKLDSRNLKKAKTILNDVFFADYED